MISQLLFRQQRLFLAALFLSIRNPTFIVTAPVTTLSTPNSTITAFTRAGTAPNCDQYVYVNKGDTCQNTAKANHITLERLTAWNPVLGYPDGRYCSEQFWAQYDYCVGVSGDSNITQVVAGPSPSSGSSPFINDKQFTRLSNDGPDSDYVADGIDCLAPANDLSSACWQKLNIENWLPQWYREEPACSTQSTQRGCRYGNEPWTTTIFKEYLGAAGVDCTTFLGKCSWFPEPSDGEDIPDKLARARYRYVCYNIVTIRDFFASWASAVDNALSAAGDLIQPIIDSIDNRPIPMKKTHLVREILLGALSIGLAFIPVFGPELGVGVGAIAATTAANAGLQAMKQAPTVANTVWPQAKDTPPQQVESDSAVLQNSMLIQSLRSNLEKGLGLVQGGNVTGISDFLAFARDSSFSSSQQGQTAPNVLSPDTQDQVQPLLSAYTTYIVSTTLAQLGWYAIMLPGVNPQEPPSDTTAYPAWVNNPKDNVDFKCPTYNATGQCSGTYWWYSKAQNSAYVLHNIDDKKDSTALLNNILTSGWSTGQLLFENAAICEMQSVLRSISTIDSSSVAYSNGPNSQLGLSFNGPLYGIASGDFVSINQSSQAYFIPFDGAGLTHIAQISDYADLFHHPNATETPLWRFDTQGIDCNCTSQLDVRVATKWGDGWTS